MKALRNYLDRIKPKLEKGGKLQKWLPVFESFETFLYVLGRTAPKKGAHIRDAVDLKRVMSVVILALIPALLFGMWNVGYQHHLSLGQEATLLQNFGFGFVKVLPIIMVSYIAGLGTEFVFVYLKGKEIEEGFLVSGMLIPLVMPVDVPLWMVAVSTVFAVVFGKEAFGGTGMNFINPALLARAFLFFSYPAKMSGDKVWVAGLENGQNIVDGFSGATPMAHAASATSNLDAFYSHYSISDLFFGFIPGSIGETSKFAILIGAIILLYTGVASWRIMLSGVIGCLFMGGVLNLFATETNAYMSLPFYEHLLLGGFAFGIVFMATDPVSGAQTNKGKWIYGFLIGVLSIMIRVLNPAYPEGVMLAILLMNVFAPLIDHYIIQANISKRLKRAKLANIVNLPTNADINKV
jgi:Na+-transporting NADH:ubiquinone oxidoreductase subunit B